MLVHLAQVAVFMRRWLLVAFILVAVLGCAQPAPVWTGPMGEPLPVAIENPMRVPVADHECVWNGVVDVLSEYFRIEREEPVRVLGNTITEGRIETFPKHPGTYLEPWEQDAANGYERLESTLQTIRHWAVARVIPAPEGGFWIDVAVFKELEDMPRPEYSTAGAATFRYDNSLNRVINPDRLTGGHAGWIPLGRDTALEQRILGHLQYRFSPMGQPIPLR